MRVTSLLAVALCVAHVRPGLAAPATEEPAALSEAASAILAGAREEARRRTRYDITMGYHVTSFKEGRDTGKPQPALGDIDPSIGVCTDLVVRALRSAGYDLQVLVAADRRKSPSSYPRGRVDPNIDHRRVPNLYTFFRRHGLKLATREGGATLRGGDIVIWYLKGRGRMDHIGIVSDRKAPGTDRPLVIHNYPSPGYTAELDVLEAWRIAAAFRFPRDGRRAR